MDPAIGVGSMFAAIFFYEAWRRWRALSWPEVKGTLVYRPDTSLEAWSEGFFKLGAQQQERNHRVEFDSNGTSYSVPIDAERGFLVLLGIRTWRKVCSPEPFFVRHHPEFPSKFVSSAAARRWRIFAVLAATSLIIGFSASRFDWFGG